ncbi:hypothetical protein D3C71_2003790 [compost metagenome]
MPHSDGAAGSQAANEAASAPSSLKFTNGEKNGKAWLSRVNPSLCSHSDASTRRAA